MLIETLSLASLCLSLCSTTINVFPVPSPGLAPTLAVPCFQNTCPYSICLTSLPGIIQELSPLGYLWVLTVLLSLPLFTIRPQHPCPHLLALGLDTTLGVLTVVSEGPQPASLGMFSELTKDGCWVVKVC